MACFAALLTLGLAACGGGGDGPGPVAEMPEPMPPEPTPFEVGLAAIEAADTADAAQAAYDAVDQTAITGDEAAKLQTALAGQLTALATAARAAEQLADLMDAADMIDTSDLSTQDLVDAARAAIAALRQALDDAADVSDADKEPYQTALNDAVGDVDDAQGGIDTATRRTEQMAALSDASDDLQAALAALSGTTPTQALLDAANTARTALNDALAAAMDLTYTEKAPYQREADNAATPIAMAQSTFDDAEDEAEKARIAEMAALALRLHMGIGDDPLLATARAATYGAGGNADDIAVVIDAAVAGRVASPRFDQSAGTKTFELPDNTVRLTFPGSYHGVPGTYYCDPTATTCTVTVATEGFTLTTGTWTFKATDPEARLMNVPDPNYVSYGWWIHTAENGALTVSAFTDNKGADPTALTIGDLRGTATYTGGAAGQYALRSLTGGTNDAGHFTADVTLNATFAAAHSISGTINNFVGADGEARDWSVALNSSVVGAAGAIAGDPDDTTDTEPQNTVWTIGEMAGDAGGEWSGALQDAGDDGVPQFATGTFHSVFGADGQMVGAFGADKDD